MRHSAKRELLQIALKEFETEEHRRVKLYNRFIETLKNLIDVLGCMIVNHIPAFKKRPVLHSMFKQEEQGVPERIPIPGKPGEFKTVIIMD